MKGVSFMAGVERVSGHGAMPNALLFEHDGSRVILTLSDNAWEQLERIVRHRGYDKESNDLRSL